MLVNMAKLESAGLLLYRQAAAGIEVLIVHPGGPFWRKRDEQAWSIPKGEILENEAGLDVARREFEEEIGVAPPAGPLIALGSVRQAGGKTVHAWAVAGDLDLNEVRSNSFEMEWPPGSGQKQQFPEVDRAGWFDLDTARRKLNAGQAVLVDRLKGLL